MTEDRLPVVVAVGQAIERDDTVSPLELARKASEVALSQAPSIWGHIDRVSFVNVLSGGGGAPAAALAGRLGLRPETTEVSTVGGNSPQWLVNKAAAAISRGEAQAVLVAGAEAQRSRRLTRASGKTPGAGDRIDVASRTVPDHAPDPVVGDDRPGASPAELAAGLVLPVNLYAMFESVLAHRASRSYPDHRAALGRLMAPMTEVAAKNPFAWFQQSLTPEEISDTADDNRLVSEPYPKRMCAFMQVDQAAAVLVTSLARARAAGVADDAIFCLSGADANDVWFPSARPDLGSSAGITTAVNAALSAAETNIDDVSALDLYSCFPCAVQMAISGLGLGPDDSRGLTVTGGLPYFGGPGNNYTLHAIATMVEVLRERGGTGLVTGLGWYATKHSAGVYGNHPPVRGWRIGGTRSLQEEIDATALAVLAPDELQAMVTERPGLEACVVASTVAVDRDDKTTAAPVVADLDDGRRVAVAAADEELPWLAGRNLVGWRVSISGDPPRFRVID